MKILMVAPESVPFVKVGGLADVVGALSLALASKGHDVRLVLPKYPSLNHCESLELIEDASLQVHLGIQDAHTRVWTTQFPDSSARAYFLEYNLFFGSGSVYKGPSGDESDNGYRFSLLSKGALDLCNHLNWIPDIVHCHDWTTGMVPAFLNTDYFNQALGQAASVMTIHNLQHQGYFDPKLIQFSGLSKELFREDGFESCSQMNLLKGGLYHTTKLTTVSPSYAQEIQTEAYGCGLESVVRFRSADLIGVINGIDSIEWDPEKDATLASPFSADDLAGKIACKQQVQERYGLEENAELPLFAVVSRLYEQKGLDLLIAIIDRLMERTNIQIAILGTGEPDIEEAFRHYSNQYSQRISAVLEFDNALAHQTIAGSDFLLMPSRFEPCGLSQMYGMKYGTVPIVRSTGGLIDSVPVSPKDWSKGGGFSFESIDPEAFLEVILAAKNLYTQDKPGYKSMQLKGMKSDFTWELSASKYEEIYAWAKEARLNAFS